MALTRKINRKWCCISALFGPYEISVITSFEKSRPLSYMQVIHNVSHWVIFREAVWLL
jgi:hypothetical protein